MISQNLLSVMEDDDSPSVTARPVSEQQSAQKDKKAQEESKQTNELVLIENKVKGY